MRPHRNPASCTLPTPVPAGSSFRATIVAIAHFRFYAELNNFLAHWHRQRTFSHPCSRDATVKHMIEALGVPHTEVEMIWIDGQAVDFSHRLQDGERVSVYPAFSSID